jgi:hypothetical protein
MGVCGSIFKPNNFEFRNKELIRDIIKSWFGKG